MSTPSITAFLPAPSALGAGSQNRQASPAPILRYQLQRHIPGWKREGLALTCPGLEESWGWGQAEGSVPFPGPSRKGLCGALAPPPGVGTFLGRGLASSPSLCRGAEARGQGWGGGTLNGPLCPLTRGLCGQARGPHTSAPRAPPAQHPGARPGMVPVAPSRRRCPHRYPLLVQEVGFSPIPGLATHPCPGLLSLSLRGRGSWFWEHGHLWA